jgi:hypothetical protein
MLECRQFPGALYEGGGLADQPAGLVKRMRYAYTVWSVIGDWKSAKNRAEWCDRNPHDWKIVQYVIKLREEAKRDIGSAD